MPVCKKPMSGIMRTTVSPSISSSTRSTPWVDGCWGPMFRIMVRSCPGSSTGVGFRWAISFIAISAVALHGIILAQRMAFPILRHQNAPQIRMPGETHAKQIENLALEVIGSRTDRSERLDCGAGAIQGNLQPDAFFVPKRKQVIDNFKGGFGRIQVHASDVRKKIK